MITLLIIAITAITSIRAFNDRHLVGQLIFAPNYIQRTGQWYRFLSYGLLHADWIHLIFNMLAFYSFGRIVESTFVTLYPTAGKTVFAALYVLALPLSTLVDFFKYRNNPSYTALGASGAVSAVIFASILIAPTAGIYILPIPIEIPAYIFGPLYLVFCIYMAKNANDNIGHLAHFFGAIFGLIFTSVAIPGIWEHFFRQIF